jgi:hypothetical protein
MNPVEKTPLVPPAVLAEASNAIDDYRRGSFERLTFYLLKKLYLRREKPIEGSGEKAILIIGAPFVFIADLAATTVWWVSIAVAFLLLGLAYVVSCGFICIKDRVTWNRFLVWLAVLTSGVFGFAIGGLFGLVGVIFIFFLAYQGAFRPGVVVVQTQQTPGAQTPV